MSSLYSYLPLFENLRSSTDYSYDSRIDDYNWLMIFASLFLLYFGLYLLSFKIIPEPGPFKEFEKKGKTIDYYLYYFNAVGMFHALISLASVPIVLYMTGNRYGQPNHLL